MAITAQVPETPNRAAWFKPDGKERVISQCPHIMSICSNSLRHGSIGKFVTIVHSTSIGISLENTGAMDMKRSQVILGMTIGLFGLSACTSYNLAGEFEGEGTTFVGSVMVSLGDNGTIKVGTEDGLLQCEGHSQVTKRPSGYALTGAQGSATATCNDGRTFKVDFIQTSESGGEGRGIDSNGNIVKVFFDKSSSVARDSLNMHRLNTLVQ